MKRLCAFFLMFSLCLLQAFAESDNQFCLVTSVSQLHVGDEVVIVSRNHCAAISKYEASPYIKSCHVDVLQNGAAVEVNNDSVAVFVMEKSGSSWSFKNEDKGWLWASARVSYELSFSSDKPKAKSNMAEVMVNADGNAIIEFGVKTYKYLKYNPKGKFGCYLYDDSQEHVQIYRRVRRMASLTLSEEADNTPALKEASGCLVESVCLERTFVADGGFYSLCLPFSLNYDDLSQSLPGVAVMRLARALSKEAGKVEFSFSRVREIIAGEPYIIKVEGGDIIDPVFFNREIEAAEPKVMTVSVNDDSYDFKGTFSPKTLPANGITRFISSDGMRLVTPNGEGSLKAMRAYFVLPDVKFSTGFAGSAAQNVYSVSVETSIDAPTITSDPTVAYDLSGRKTSSRSKGIIIVDGKKILNKQ
ncbi:hypothetical protein [Prevotella sp.]|uniref:hypothetical protein n=1 Tax=Prevotella sp. TaxID=59823 RepID=UPI0025FF0776|nr:hypothetical protein [Prevotella sp.]